MEHCKKCDQYFFLLKRTFSWIFRPTFPPDFLKAAVTASCPIMSIIWSCLTHTTLCKNILLNCDSGGEVSETIFKPAKPVRKWCCPCIHRIHVFLVLSLVCLEEYVSFWHKKMRSSFTQSVYVLKSQNYLLFIIVALCLLDFTVFPTVWRYSCPFILHRTPLLNYIDKPPVPPLAACASYWNTQWNKAWWSYSVRPPLFTFPSTFSTCQGGWISAREQSQEQCLHCWIFFRHTVKADHANVKAGPEIY